MDALGQAGTKVHEPIRNFHLECPSDSVGALISEMSKPRAVPNEPTVRGAICSHEGTIAASKVPDLQRLLPGLTRGEGFLDTDFSHHAPVIGDYPVRPRTDSNPLDCRIGSAAAASRRWRRPQAGRAPEHRRCFPSTLRVYMNYESLIIFC